MTAFSDLEMTRLAAEAMGYDVKVSGDVVWCAQPFVAEDHPDAWFINAPRTVYSWFAFAPLTDDAQCFALVKHIGMAVWGSNRSANDWKWHAQPTHAEGSDYLGNGVTANRAVVESVAQMQSAKQSGCIGVGR